MKNRNFIKNSMLLLLPISLGLGVLLGVNKPSKVEQVDGYSTSSLPTTIYLKDSTADEIRTYYSSLTNLDPSERQGNNLLKNLKTILKNGQKYYAYDDSNAIWQIYEITDRDWTRSPASSTTYGTYNSGAETITNYVYGTGSGSSSKNNPYIHALYINRDVTNQTKAWDDHQQTQWGINREHVWPKAEGFEASGKGGARGDPMHLMAGNGYSNNIHSNYYYGYVKTSGDYTDVGKKYSNQSGNLRGTSLTLNTGTVFEPQDCDKGDIARAIFYMVARYNYLSESDSDGINSNNPNLELTQSISDWSSSGYSSTTTKTGKMGIMTDLLNWHHQDPVDQYEIHRNNLLYKNYTNNRNPFIDFPEWVDHIWGTVTYNGRNYQNKANPTGYADPDNDTINGYNSGSTDPISVTGFSLEKSETSITVGGAETLESTITPSNATNRGITWVSGDTSIVTVTNGTIRGVAEGTATITATTSDGGFADTCTVTVVASGSGGGGSSGDTIVTWEKVTSFSSLNAGDTVIITNAESTYALSNVQNTSNRAAVAVSANNNLLSWEVDPDKYPEELVLTSTSSVNAAPDNSFGFYSPTGYLYAASSSGNHLKTQDSMDLNSSFAISIGVTESSAIASNATNSRKVLRFNPNTSNNNPLFACYNTDSTTGSLLAFYKKNVSVAGRTLAGITLDTSDVKTIFTIGDAFNYDELVVNANYNDGTDEILTSGYTIESPDMATYGKKTVTVSYDDFEAEYSISVNYAGASDDYQMIVNKSTSSYFEEGAISLSGTATEGTAECSAFTATQTKEGGSNSINYAYDEIRVYGNHSFIVTPKEGYIITSIVVFADNSNYANTIGVAGLPNVETITVDDSVVTLIPTTGTLGTGFRNGTVARIDYIIVNFEQLSLSWSAPEINVFSGDSLEAAEVNSWAVSDGTNTYDSAQLTVKLGGTSISLPYTWKADDDLKTLTASVNGVSTPESDPVCVTQTINQVYKTVTPSSGTVSWTATSAENLGSTISSVNGTDTGHISTGTFEWDYTRKLVNLASNRSDYLAFQNSTWIQMGSSNALESIVLTTSTIPGTITSVSVTAATAGTHKLTIDVGGVKYKNAADLTTYSSTASATNPKPSDCVVTGTGTSSGAITITIASTTTTTNKAMLLRSISVSYEESGAPVQIANNVDHIEAQRVAVKYAKAFNAAMDTTAYCTTNMSSAWTECSSAYDTFISEASALGSTEEAYAKNLIKYATAQYTDNSGEACIERMLKTYEICVEQHGKSAFMSSLVSLSNSTVKPALVSLSNNKNVILIVLVSIISVGAIGGYFFLRSRRKEEF